MGGVYRRDFLIVGDSGAVHRARDCGANFGFMQVEAYAVRYRDAIPKSVHKHLVHNVVDVGLCWKYCNFVILEYFTISISPILRRRMFDSSFPLR